MKRHLLPFLLVACTLIVALWLVLARQSGQPFKPFDLSASDFAGFQPSLPDWEVRSIPVSTNDPAEPNIAAYVVERGKREAGSGERAAANGIREERPANNHQPSTMNHEPFPLTAVIRLVHGYNMPMCMKIKGYTVEAISDRRLQTSDQRPRMADPLFSDTDTPTRRYADTLSSSPLPLQGWRVTSSGGDVSIWVTTMIRAGDFAPTSVDICSMAFPRVDLPDDPRWVPRGFTWADARHPVKSLRQWGRNRWNASRTDLLTFLRLRQPAWASEELLTYVTCSVAPEVKGGNENDILRGVVGVHAQMLGALQGWRAGQIREL
jgi:hypothetical protein